MPRRVPSKAYRTWTAQAGLIINAARGRARAAGLTLPLTGEVALSLVVQRPRRGSDLSNRIKAVEDALVAGAVLRDDCLVSDLRAAWARDVEGGSRRAGRSPSACVRTGQLGCWCRRPPPWRVVW